MTETLPSAAPRADEPQRDLIPLPPGARLIRVADDGDMNELPFVSAILVDPTNRKLPVAVTPLGRIVVDGLHMVLAVREPDGDIWLCHGRDWCRPVSRSHYLIAAQQEAMRRQVHAAKAAPAPDAVEG